MAGDSKKEPVSRQAAMPRRNQYWRFFRRKRGRAGLHSHSPSKRGTWFWRLALAALFSTAGITAQPAAQSDLHGPVLGYAFDAAAGGLRPLIGIPGSSLVGGTLDAGARLSRADVSPRQDYAVATAASSGEVLLILLGNGASRAGRAPASIIPGLAPWPARVVFSPRGSCAALAYTHELILLRGLPSAAAPVSIDLSRSPFSGVAAIKALALSDDGAAALGEVQDNGAGAVYVLSTQSPPRYLTQVAAGAAEFLPGTHAAVIADRQRGEMVLFQDVIGAVPSRVLATSRDGIADAAALAASPDGRFLVAASADSDQVAIIPADGTPATILASPTHSKILKPLRQNMLFQLGSLSAGRVFLLDASAPAPKFYFVPAPATERAGPFLSLSIPGREP